MLSEVIRSRRYIICVWHLPPHGLWHPALRNHHGGGPLALRNEVSHSGGDLVLIASCHKILQRLCGLRRIPDEGHRHRHRLIFCFRGHRISTDRAQEMGEEATETRLRW